MTPARSDILSAESGSVTDSVRGPRNTAGMTIWKDVESAEPGFAARVQALFDAHTHKTIATLRADGAPRISGIEVQFVDGEVRFGSMAGSRKSADLRRDPRFALHSATVEAGESWAGDAKVSGRAVFDGPLEGDGSGDGFRAEIDGVVLTALNATRTMLVVETWTPGGGMRRVERA